MYKTTTEEISIYPNFLDKTLDIVINNNKYLNSIIFILNLLGDTILEINMKNNNMKSDISYLSKGIYYAKIVHINKTIGIKQLIIY